MGDSSVISPLRTAEQIYQELLANPDKVVLKPTEALEVWKIFRTDQLDIAYVTALKPRAFLQGALMSAIDASFAMSWIESVFRSSMKPTATVTGLLKSLATTAFKHFYRHLKNEPAELYRSVVSTIAWSHKFYFDAIANGMADDLL